MPIIFILQGLFYYLCALASVEVMECLLYDICLAASAYYFYKTLFEDKKHYKLAYVFLSYVIFTFIIICRFLDLIAASSSIT